jgi:hypothetical protein
MRYLIVLFLLSGCAAASTVISAGVYVATDKTPTDHVLSYNTGMDCQTVRLIENQKVCQPYKIRFIERKK